MLPLPFSNAVFVCQWTHWDLQLWDSLQHHSLDTGEALLSSSEEGVDSAELRSQTILTDNEELSTDVHLVLVQG